MVPPSLSVHTCAAFTLFFTIIYSPTVYRVLSYTSQGLGSGKPYSIEQKRHAFALRGSGPGVGPLHEADPYPRITYNYEESKQYERRVGGGGGPQDVLQGSPLRP